MAVSFIVSEIKQDIGRKLQFSDTSLTLWGFPSTGQNIALAFGM